MSNTIFKMLVKAAPGKRFAGMPADCDLNRWHLPTAGVLRRIVSDLGLALHAPQAMQYFILGPSEDVQGISSAADMALTHSPLNTFIEALSVLQSTNAVRRHKGKATQLLHDSFLQHHF